MHWENKSPSSCIYTISCLSWQKQKSDWHISAAKDDKHHNHPIQIKDLMNPWEGGNPINHMGHFQQLETIKDGGILEEMCRAKWERDKKEWEPG